MRLRFALNPALALGTGCLLLWSPSAEAVIIPINPATTYLHDTSGGGAAPAISLGDLGISGGATIMLQGFGDFDNGPDADTFTDMNAVFSGSDVLLAATELNRVQDAIDAGTDDLTPLTLSGSEPTDIPEDFAIVNGGIAPLLVMQVPIGATHLFVTAIDIKFNDNSDPDGDFALEIILVPEPSTALLLASGLALIGRRRQRAR